MILKGFIVSVEPKSQVKISGEIPYEELAVERESAIKALGSNVNLDGFRKGHVPTAVLEKHIGEMAILTEMAERAISHMYPHILEEHKIDAIGYPKLKSRKLLQIILLVLQPLSQWCRKLDYLTTKLLPRRPTKETKPGSKRKRIRG